MHSAPSWDIWYSDHRRCYITKLFNIWEGGEKIHKVLCQKVLKQNKLFFISLFATSHFRGTEATGVTVIISTVANKTEALLLQNRSSPNKILLSPSHFNQCPAPWISIPPRHPFCQWIWGNVWGIIILHSPFWSRVEDGGSSGGSVKAMWLVHSSSLHHRYTLTGPSLCRWGGWCVCELPPPPPTWVWLWLWLVRCTCWGSGSRGGGEG